MIKNLKTFFTILCFALSIITVSCEKDVENNFEATVVNPVIVYQDFDELLTKPQFRALLGAVPKKQESLSISDES